MKSIYEERPWLSSYPEWSSHDLETGSAKAIDDFIKSAQSGPDRPACCYFEHSISYGEIDALSDALAAATRGKLSSFQKFRRL